MTTIIRFIGDIHGQFGRYETLIECCHGSIQVGDLGVGFLRWPHGGEQSNPPYDKMVAGNHRFIRGNHDNPHVCRKHSQCIKDGTIEGDMMFIGGAQSIDQAYRIEGFNWWPEEELSIKELNELVDKYRKAKPRVMVTHDCPEEVASIVLARMPYEFSPSKIDFKSRTRLAFQEMFSAHSPDFWIFAHYHFAFDHVLRGGREKGTRFICVAQDTFTDLDIDDVLAAAKRCDPSDLHQKQV
jgi:Calcineurin-like phosphoesterase